MKIYLPDHPAISFLGVYSRKMATDIFNNIDEFWYTEGNKSDTKEYILYHFIHANAIKTNLDYSDRKHMNKSKQLCDWKQTGGLWE